MRTRLAAVLAFCLVSLAVLPGIGRAFTDTAGDPAEKEILALEKAGIVNGIGGGSYAPGEPLTNAAGIHLLVKGLGLNMNTLLIKTSMKVEDYFSKIPEGVWYSRSFLIAKLNGLSLSTDLDPKVAMTREEYAKRLMEAISTTGDYAYPEIWMMLKDEDEVDRASMDAIQKLLILKIAELKDGSFDPKRIITRSEAAKMLVGAIQFVESMKAESGKPEGTKELTYDFGGHDEKEMATYREGDGFYLYVPERLEMESADAGQTVLTTVEIPHSTLSLKKVASKSDLTQLKKAASERLSKEYPQSETVELKADSPYAIPGASFLLQAKDSSTLTFAGVLESEGELYEVSIKLWQSETWTYPVFRAVLDTLKPLAAESSIAVEAS
ncbi:S-layer homology domain-containing protein [Gorillibacterium timonense]|uniref:S-layer homology domain-containing protein n=1 Tax=Gorillibacterium timonense TaxID=1689269 RepID=UPI00131BF087|nr:S-layer homology domain-containing protein [Gorillibacterium timonense]